MMTAYTIVKMIRAYSKRFNVLVPFRCQSAGTQIAVGADGIVIGKIGQLSPVDPSTANLFNPLLDEKISHADPRNRKPISVEDVQAYLNLAKKRVGLVSENDTLEVFKQLTNKYEPLALGNVNRVYSVVKTLIKELLSLHMNPKKEEDEINEIVKSLTEIYTHDFNITFDVAKKIGLKVIEPDDKVEKLMLDLYSSYESEMKMDIPFDADPLIPNPQFTSDQNNRLTINQTNFIIKVGAIESKDMAFSGIVDTIVHPPIANILQNLLSQPGYYPPRAAITFKPFKWKNNNELTGVSFE